MSEAVETSSVAAEPTMPDNAGESFSENGYQTDSGEVGLASESEGDISSGDLEGQSEMLSDSEEAAMEDAGLTEEQKQEVRKIKKLQLKVNGKVYEEELPFEIDDDPQVVEYMKRQLQMAKFGQTKAQEYSKLENDISAFFQALKADPRKVLSDPSIGLDLKELAKMVIEEEIEQSQKTPEQIEKEQLEARLRELEEEREREREMYRQQELERITQQEFERYDMLMDKAISDAGLPKSPYIVKKMADYMISGISQGLNVQPADVIDIVKEEMNNDLKEMFSVMPAEVLNELLGNETYDKVRKYRVSKARKKSPKALKNKNFTDVGKVTKEKPKVETKKKTIKELLGV